MKRNRPHTPVILETVEQRTFFSFTAAPISAAIAATPAWAAPRGAAADMIQMPFMHQLHGPSDQFHAPSAITVTPVTSTDDSTTTASPTVSADSASAAQPTSVSVKAPLSDTAITDSSVASEIASESFVTDWTIPNETTANTITNQQSVSDSKTEQTSIDDGLTCSSAIASAQPQADEANDFQALLTYVRQSKSEDADAGMFSRERIPALHEMSAGMYSRLAEAHLSESPLAASRIMPSSTAQPLIRAESPSQTMFESLTPNWWVWAGSLIVLAAQRFSSKPREEKPQNQFQFLTADWNPQQIDSKE
jgi:hypothetical protein